MEARSTRPRALHLAPGDGNLSLPSLLLRRDNMQPKILLVNPPIDFSAYGYRLKPYGLLRVAGYLRGQTDLYLVGLSRPLLSPGSTC
ncbi:hypothetical protein NKDENANG_03176 [Candidatus Entotheonellaceae bacterium PAL068K]